MIYKSNDYIKLMRPLPSYVQRDIYDIPFIEAEQVDISGLNNDKWLINMKNAKAADPNASQKIVHSFCYDDDLYRAYNNPINYLHRVSKYYAVASPDFSMHKGMDFAQILSATYRNRWTGAFLQANGVRAIATVGWMDEQHDNICFAGLRNGSVFIISTLGVKNKECKAPFLRGYLEMRRRLPDSKIICVGSKVDGMDADVRYVSYKESFGNWEQYPGYWQTRFLDAGDIALCGGDV